MNESRPESRHCFIFAAVAGFALAICAFAPAGIAASALKRAVPMMSIAGAEGTVWKGRLIGVAHGDVFLGDIDFRVLASNLLIARATVDMTSAAGALEGAARVEFTPDAIELERVFVNFNLGAIRQYSFFGAPYQGALKVTAERLRLTGAGCEAENAVISTSAFDALAQRWSGGAFPMDGAIKCVDGALMASLKGEGADGAADLSVTIRSDLTYSLVVAARPRKPDIGRALEFFGFEKRGDDLSYKAVGVLKGLSS